MSGNHAAILKVIAAYEQRWTERDFRGLRSLWPVDEETPFWSPEEVDRPLTDWDAVGHYILASEELIERISVRTSDHLFKELAPYVVGAVWKLHWNASVWFGNPPRTRAIAGDVSVSAVFKRVAEEDWRFVLYHESALGPLPFVRREYERLVDPDFVAGS